MAALAVGGNVRSAIRQPCMLQNTQHQHNMAAFFYSIGSQAVAALAGVLCAQCYATHIFCMLACMFVKCANTKTLSKQILLSV